MNDFDRELSARLDTLKEQGLFRELRRVDSTQGTHLQVGDRRLLNFSSNDYLGLASHPVLREAAIQAVERYGAGSGAARLLCGSLAPHHELEAALAAFKGTAAALTFSNGYATALGAITALVGAGDVVVIDRLAHACLVDAARLSGAKLRVFAHNNLEDLERILQWADRRKSGTETGGPGRRARTLIVTESVFSMDGDQAPLREIVALKERHGAWLMVDEAHATGLFGEHRRGLAEALGVAERIEIQMGTLGKALGAAGGYVAGSRTLVDFLVNRARSFLFSTAPVPAQAAAARAAIELVRADAGARLRDRLWETARLAADALRTAGWAMPTTPGFIVPLMLGDESRAVEAARKLREQGLYLPAVRYPTVARGQARLRVTLTAAHTDADIDQLAAALAAAVPAAPDFRHAPTRPA